MCFAMIMVLSRMLVSCSQSMLTKKHNAINYHAIREAVAAIIRIGKEEGVV